MVTFRISAEEYEAVAKACVGSRSRSISDFARAAVLERVKTLHSSAGTLNGDLSTLSSTLGDLDVSIREVSRRIRRVLGPVAAER